MALPSEKVNGKARAKGNDDGHGSESLRVQRFLTLRHNADVLVPPSAISFNLREPSI